MTEFDQAVREQTDEVYGWRAELNLNAMEYIESLEEYVEQLEKFAKIRGHHIRHTKDTDSIASAYQKLACNWQRELATTKAACEGFRQQYKESWNHKWAAECALDLLVHKQQPEGAEPPPAHIVVDENGNTTPADLYLREWPKWTTRKKED